MAKQHFRGNSKEKRQLPQDSGGTKRTTEQVTECITLENLSISGATIILSILLDTEAVVC